MPIIKSAKKRVKQALKRKIQNNKFRRRLHDFQKDFYDALKNNDIEKATKELPNVYKVIDTCAKKNIIPQNRANRMKSKAQKQLSAQSK